MLNKIVVMGRLTKDPELRYTANETPVASFSLAVDRNYATKDGERETDFFDIVAWRHTGEFVSRNFIKGQLVAVEGRMQRRQWTDRDGNKRYAYEVIADSVHFAGHNRNNEPSAMPDDYDPYYELAAA